MCRVSSMNVHRKNKQHTAQMHEDCGLDNMRNQVPVSAILHLLYEYGVHYGRTDDPVPHVRQDKKYVRTTPEGERSAWTEGRTHDT